MSKRVVLDYGHGSNSFPPSKGVYLPGGGEFHEHTYNSNVGEELKEILERNGIEVYLTQEPHSPEVSLNTRIEKVNAEHRKNKIDLLVSIHANASSSSSASGFGVFYWTTSKNGKRAAELMVGKMRKKYPIGSWGNGLWVSERGSWTNFGILRRTLMPAILTEGFFFTNRSERELMTKPENVTLAAIAHARAIGEYLGVSINIAEESDALYRVQTGAFANFENAVNLEKELDGEGFDTYLVKADDGLYKVQTGAFANKGNAEDLSSRLESAGYETYITTRSGEAANYVPRTEEQVQPISKGDKVRVKDNVSYTGQRLSRNVLSNTYDVIQTNGDRIVIGVGSTVTAAVHLDNIRRV